MEWIHWALDFVLHLNKHLTELIADYGVWTYAILAAIVFCETGLVVTPFLPGDSLLFAAGALAAGGSLDPLKLSLLLIAAAVLGDNVNYHIGYYLGHRLYARGDSRLFKRKHLERTQRFYERYGGKTIVIARFVPIVRTFAPFVAGVGRMRYAKFLGYSVAGGTLWVAGLVYLGYLFGTRPVVEKNFGLVIVAIIAVSILPAVVELARARWGKGQADSGDSRNSGGRGHLSDHAGSAGSAAGTERRTEENS